MHKYYVLIVDVNNSSVDLKEFTDKHDAENYAWEIPVSTWVFPASQLARIMKLYQQSLKTN